MSRRGILSAGCAYLLFREVAPLKPWKEGIQRPVERMMSRTLVEIVGKQRLLVEHHRGILGYGTEEILVGTDYGILRITGAELRLCCMSRQQLFISGRIDDLALEGRE